jgi:DNA-directed RNA polymerase specialized sigma24 family protein
MIQQPISPTQSYDSYCQKHQKSILALLENYGTPQAKSLASDAANEGFLAVRHQHESQLISEQDFCRLWFLSARQRLCELAGRAASPFNISTRPRKSKAGAQAGPARAADHARFEPCSPDPFFQSLSALDRLDLDERFAALSPDENRVIVLRARGESLRRVSAMLGRSPTAVRMLLDNALRKLRDDDRHLSRSRRGNPFGRADIDSIPKSRVA